MRPGAWRVANASTSRCDISRERMRVRATTLVVALARCCTISAIPVEALRVGPQVAWRRVERSSSWMNVSAEAMPPAGDPVETFFATASVLWCCRRAEWNATRRPSAPSCAGYAPRTGRGRRATSLVEILPIDHPFWRFYRLSV